MNAFHRILILAFGFALSFNAWSQNQLDPADTTDCYFKCLKKYLLTPERKCGIIIAPSFTNLFGISLSPDCDMLTLIEMKNPYFSQLNDSDDEDDEDDSDDEDDEDEEDEEDDEDEDEEDVSENNNEKNLDKCYSENKRFELTDRNFPVRKIAIEPVNGKRLSELLDIAVEKPRQYYYGGLDGTEYYFCASNGNTGETWSPPMKHSNCYKLVGIVSKLLKAIQDNTPDSLDNKLWSEIDSLNMAFKNDPVTKFPYVKWIDEKKDEIPAVKFYSEGDTFKGPYFDATMTVPADFRPGSTKEDLSHILNDREIESTFIDFSSSLKRWNEKPAKIYVKANITIDDNGKESYEVKIAEKGYAILNFTLPLSKFSLENLIEQEDLCLKKFVEEKEAAKAAASPSPK